MIDKYELDYKNKHDIPNIFYNVFCRKFNGYCEYEKMYSRVWMSEGKLNLVSIDNCSDRNKITIDVNNIEFFTRDGDVYNYSEVTGGSSGGYSLKGAIIGGVLAGGVGAVIGSRKQGEAIKTKNIVEDNRITILKVKKGDLEFLLEFDAKDYDVFQRLIPNKNKLLIKDTISEDDVYDQLKKLASLKECGILTNEEFENKKKILLNKIG